MAIECSQCAWERKYAKALPIEQRVCRLHASMNARDSDWIARELGDVPYRTMQLTCHDNPQSWAPVLQGRDA